jgi:hypothetical protein
MLSSTPCNGSNPAKAAATIRFLPVEQNELLEAMGARGEGGEDQQAGRKRAAQSEA